MQNNRIETVLRALEKNNINAVFVPKREDVKETVRGMLFEGAIISSGGSVSLVESGVLELIKSEDYCYLDRLREGITPEEQQEVFKKIIGCDFYFCSANALTENGELVNVDGFANRISAIAFGPKKVIAVVGINKLVKNVNEGFLRVKKIAAPKNCVRLGIDNPCARLGHCVSLETNDNPEITDGCSKNSRICVNYLVTARQREANRITVILCGEELGY